MARLRTFIIVLIAAITLASPVGAQSFVARDVAFFERVAVGFVEVTPITVWRDSRCFDPAVCFREDTLVISVVLHDQRRLREVILKLDEPVEVPGGYLMLASAGTPPVRNGAIRLEKYNLELVYLPYSELGDR